MELGPFAFACFAVFPVVVTRAMTRGAVTEPFNAEVFSGAVEAVLFVEAVDEGRKLGLRQKRVTEKFWS